MKHTYILFILTLILGVTNAKAHALWLETQPTGKIGEAQVINVYFGEYGYGMIEEVGGEAFQKVNQFKVWLTTPSGKKEALKATIVDSVYQVTYTPQEKGIYTVELDNDQIDVIDYTQYDFGIFKTHYHSTTHFKVGEEKQVTTVPAKSGLVIFDSGSTASELKLKIYYKGELLKENEVNITIADNWSKTVYTNEQGEIQLNLPWQQVKYFVEVTLKEEVPGTYKDEPYEFIWHCATYMVTGK